MRRTPLTAAMFRKESQDYPTAKFARELEEKLGDAGATIDALSRKLDAANACLESWKSEEGADAKRFEWIFSRAAYDFRAFDMWGMSNADEIRSEVDKAMKGEQS